MRNYKALWVDKELKAYMSQRDEAKRTPQITGSITDRQKYCKLRNHVTKLNQKKKKQHYVIQLSRKINDGKKLWSTLNDIMGRHISLQPHFMESGGTFIKE